MEDDNRRDHTVLRRRDGRHGRVRGLRRGYRFADRRRWVSANAARMPLTFLGQAKGRGLRPRHDKSRNRYLYLADRAEIHRQNIQGVWPQRCARPQGKALACCPPQNCHELDRQGCRSRKAYGSGR